MTTMSELRTIECRICHLDTPVEDQQHGVCHNCVENIENQKEYANLFWQAGLELPDILFFQIVTFSVTSLLIGFKSCKLSASFLVI